VSKLVVDGGENWSRGKFGRREGALREEGCGGRDLRRAELMECRPVTKVWVTGAAAFHLNDTLFFSLFI
jgi:hypothetical protein